MLPSDKELQWTDSSVRQMNIDYSDCQALSYTDATEFALLIYDICCQWSLHFAERVSKFKFLSLCEGIKITPAVGKFHLGAHIKECFFLFSLNFIEGSGQVDGEIMETLWAVLNKVAGMTRAMSGRHQQEMLDDYMNDGNWKKFVWSSKF
jgi:Kyakuja-Dileera-Zisupton transposase